MEKIKKLLNFNFNQPSRLIKYKAKKKAAALLFSLFRIVLLVAVGYIVLYPLLFMIVTALRDRESYTDPSIVWIPRTFAWENYATAVEKIRYFERLKNTLLVEIVSAAIEIVSCSVVAYGLARFDFKLKKLLMVLLIFTIVVPSQMIVIPTMMNFAHLDFAGILGLIGKAVGTDIRPSILDTPFSFYLPSIFGVGLRSGIMIFIYIQFFKGLPKELEEAAWIDGAGPIKTFLRIAVPSSGVVFLTVTIFSIVWHWNDYYLAAMYMTDNQPLAVALANLPSLLSSLGGNLNGSLMNTISGSVVMACCLLFITPVLIMYVILQRKFVKSIDRVGITG